MHACNVISIVTTFAKFASVAVVMCYSGKVKREWIFVFKCLLLR